MSVKTYLNPQADLGLAKIFVNAPTGIPSVDTASVTAAIAKLTALGGNATMLFLDGAYTINSNTFVLQNLTSFAIRSAGNTIIYQAPNTASLPNNTSGDICVIADCTNFSVSDITFDGQRDIVSPITPLLSNISAGASNNTCEVPYGTGARYKVGTRLALYGGLYAGATSWSVAGCTSTSSAITFTATGHTMAKGQSVLISGQTGTYSTLNGFYRITSIATNTFTIASVLNPGTQTLSCTAAGSGCAYGNAKSAFYSAYDNDLVITAISTGTGPNGGDVITFNNTTTGSGGYFNSAHSYYTGAMACSSATFNGSALTFNLTTAQSLQVGDIVYCPGFDGGYAGTWTIASVIGTQPSITGFTATQTSTATMTGALAGSYTGPAPAVGATLTAGTAVLNGACTIASVNTGASTFTITSTGTGATTLGTVAPSAWANSSSLGKMHPYLSDGFGPFSAYGAHLTPYLGTSNNQWNVVARRTLFNEDQQNALHLLNCSGFLIRGVTSRNMWMSGIKCGTGFDSYIYNPCLNGCFNGTITQSRVYHGYDQGISIWCSSDIVITANPQLASCGWASVSMTATDNCVMSLNACQINYYRTPNDGDSGSGVAIEGGSNNLVVQNVVHGAWDAGVRLLGSPLSFGVAQSNFPVLVSTINAGDAPGTTYTFSCTSGHTPTVPGALNISQQKWYQYSILDGEQTEKVYLTYVNVAGTVLTVQFRDAPKFSHSAGATLVSAVAEDNIVQNNTFKNTQRGHGVFAQGGVRNTIADNIIDGTAVLTGDLNQYGLGITLGDYSNYGITIGGEGSTVRGNKISRTNNEAIALNGVSHVTVVDNHITPTRTYAAGIREWSPSDYNVIKRNKLDPSMTRQGVFITGTHTRFSAGPGFHAAALDHWILGDGPTGYWKLVEASGATTLLDSTLNNNNVVNGSGNATINSATLGVISNPCNTDQLENVLQLTGSPAYIQTGKAWPTSGTPLSGFAVECMVNLEGQNIGSGTTFDLVANSHTDVDNSGFRLVINGSATPGAATAQAYFGNGTTYYNCSSATPVPASGWFHLCAVFTSTAVILYVNGQQVGSTTFGATTVVAGLNNIAIGYNPTFAGNYAKCLLSRVAIYKSSLTATQVLNHALASVN